MSQLSNLVKHFNETFGRKLAVVGGTEHTFEFDTISNCCGAYIDPDIGFCEECWEHADVIKISK